MLTMELRAPLSGVVLPLEAVPDPVFSRKVLGEGAAIDPTSWEVLAPVAGLLTQSHEARHALAITTSAGVEVLVHVGLDSALLDGAGLHPLVKVGTAVACGQPLLRFDAELLARRARSLLSAVVVTSHQVVAMRRAEGLVEAGASTLLELSLAGAHGAEGPAAHGLRCSGEIRLMNPAGLHARPVAVLAKAARQFVSQIWLARGADRANAKSLVSILGLSARCGDLVQVRAAGPDAHEAVLQLARLLADGCGERLLREVAARLAPAALRDPGARQEYVGVPAAPGVAIGRAHVLRRAAMTIPELGDSPEAERARFEAARREASRQIEALEQHARDPAQAQLMDVQLALIEDAELLAHVRGRIAEGRSAASAWNEAFSSHADRLEQLENVAIRRRGADVRDVGRRVLVLLAGARSTDLDIPDGAIVVAEELTPSEVMSLERRDVRGFCTTAGGATSQVAIHARSLGIAAVCGTDEGVLTVQDGERIAIDGTHGVVWVSLHDGEQEAPRVPAPAPPSIAMAEPPRTAETVAQTRDGRRIDLLANARNAEEVRSALAAGAGGVGLLRTEDLFSGRDTAPTEQEQAAAYLEVAEVLGRARPLVIRTLHAGGGESLPYLHSSHDANPLLGMRGIRLSLAHRDLLRVQLRAMLRAAAVGDVHVLLPMVATLEELRAAKQLLVEEQSEIPHAVKLGVMVEVPSTAISADVFAREVDFLSIATGDLAQYTLAIDHDHPQLAMSADALHPSILRLVAMSVEGANEHGKQVYVCGGLASEPLAAPLLAGLGLDALSLDVRDIGAVRAALSCWTLEECAELATESLQLRTPREVRALLARRVRARQSTDTRG